MNYAEGGEIPKPIRFRTTAGRLAFERAFNEVVSGERDVITEARIEEILDERFGGQPGWEDEVVPDEFEIPEKPGRRVWFYKPGSWVTWHPIYFGADEWCRRTVVLGSWLTGCIVVALWRVYEPSCPKCVERKVRRG
jgi:hypothetical protein